MEDINELRKNANEGNALAELKNHNGYKELIKIFEDLYNDAFEGLVSIDVNNMNSLVTIENRLKLKVIEDVFAKIDDKVNLANDCLERLKTETFKNHRQAPD